MAESFQPQKRGLALLAFGAVLVLGVTFNELVMKSWAGTENQQRGVASANGLGQVDWERELLETYNADPKGESVTGSKPTLHDELVFGFFEGKYGARMSRQGRIETIEYLGQDGKDLISIDNKVGFLLKFKDVVSEGAIEAQFVRAGAGEEEYRLLNKSAEVVGNATFKLSGEGKVTAVEFR